MKYLPSLTFEGVVTMIAPINCIYAFSANKFHDVFDSKTQKSKGCGY